MFGTLRLCLALLVAASHMGVSIAGYNPGVVSVVVFFLLAGRVTAHLLKAPSGPAADYYLERLARIYPAYLCALLVAAAIYVALPLQSPFLPPSPTARDWIANLTVMPLALRLKCDGSCFNVVFDYRNFTLLPPAWSLGLELQFYLLAPFVLRMPPAIRTRIVLASLAVWIIAAAGGLDCDSWGYRLLPGTLFIFMAGAETQERRYALLAGLWIVACATFAAVRLGYVQPRPFNAETSLGLAIGLPTVLAVSRLPRLGADRFLGGMSYPLFLLHFPVIWLFEAVGRPVESGAPGWPLVTAILAISLAASALLYVFVDRPLEPFRDGLRARFSAGAAKRPRQYQEILPN